MIAYLDASALVKLFLDEEGSAEIRELWAGEIPVSTAEIGQTELVCALAAAVRSSRFPPDRLDQDVMDGRIVRERAELVTADAGVVRQASRLGATHGLRALDAIHLASALVLVDAEPTVVTWDVAQRRAAAAEGLPVYP